MEDEFHIILVCPLYYIFNRNKYNNPYFSVRPSMMKFVQILSSKNVKIMNNSGQYINNGLKLQNDVLP